MEAGLSKITQTLLLIAAGSCVGMLVLVNIDITLKYTINQPIPGALEIVSYYFMPIIVFCSFAHIQRHRLNIEISLFTDLLPRPIAAAIENVARLASLFYLAVFVWASTRTALETMSVGTTTGIVGYDLAIWPSRWAVPISIGATFLWILLQLRGGRRKAAV